MTRMRAVGLLLLLCLAALGWHLIQQSPTATTPATSTPPAYPTAASKPSTGAKRAADRQPAAPPTPAHTPRTNTSLAVTPRPTTTPVEADVPQDRGASPSLSLTQGPDQRRVEADEPSVIQLTNAQLQAALDEQTAGQGRLQPALEHAAATAAWKQVHSALTAAHTWSHIEPRAAVALLLGQHTDPTQPMPVNVITIWTGTDPEGVKGVHRAETKLLYSDNTWQPLN